MVRAQCRRASPDQCGVSFAQLAAAVWAFQKNHRRALAERICGAAFCAAPLARRIRRLGVRTERRPERLLLDVDSLGLRALRGAAGAMALLSRPDVLCSWIDVQINVSHSTLRAIVAGFLAAGAIAHGRESEPLTPA